MNVADIARLRLINQQLTETTLSTPVELVTWLGAVQGQEYAQSKWGLGLRLPQLTDADIERDFASGALLRTHVLRPTWHLVAAADIRWLLQLTAPRVHAINAYMYRKCELDSAIFNRCNEIMIRQLEGGTFLTRNALNQAFQQQGIEASDTRLSCIMMQAELDGLICSGPREGNQFTYALLEERVKPVATLSKEEALAEMAQRYFISRGPATIHDFATWSGLTVTDCRKGAELAKTNLTKAGDYYFKDVAPASTPTTERLYLLPMYDEFVMGYKDRSPSMLLSSESKPLSVFENLLMADGQLIGTWKRSVGTKSTDVKAHFLYSPTDAQRSVFETAVQHLQRFTNKPVTYEILQHVSK
ncbi:winged helix DNA-binding domain-containing protein [Spirosoma terrae]|uniref:Winged helix DNA-binding domain-containing protein n=1 Tax=Spirosoma terrae TaxID=1968276 RepID=A0A6L9L7D4_9BACT|nr:winged helix DNA-binding domain-containing protein [Spirosoma terrae]NDU96526.1 winged helix DNA-binding domain-containing protein [Spirosoma terrae]